MIKIYKVYVNDCFALSFRGKIAALRFIKSKLGLKRLVKHGDGCFGTGKWRYSIKVENLYTDHRIK